MAAAVTIAKRATKCATPGGATGWLVGTVAGLPWVAYDKADIKRMRQALKNRLAKMK